MARVYIDLDGTLFDNSLDAEFEMWKELIGVEGALIWYNEEKRDNLKLNKTLWDRLFELWRQGHELVIWTNRGQNQVWMTMANLARYGIHKYISAYFFFDGKKAKVAKTQDGIVFDNDYRNEVPCGEFNFIPTFTG